MRTRMIHAVLMAALGIPITARAAFYSATVIADNPALYYRLDETSGTTANDSASGAHNGTYTGTYSLNQPGALTGSNPSNAAVTINPSPSNSSGHIDSTFILNP